ncbi:hypothetical protein HMN09_00637100 [Mycena chlorophos]|uniref:Uncharacterized protein n=2 Tax=Mycena chlorophos TaxID=658473 RepID=A0ABQ0L147_MYCCL|nr:hypothetical protein HMN09_00637100 [Mycena chlorophos]GAT44212.1 predicted protein [Mycena chlorophos]
MRLRLRRPKRLFPRRVLRPQRMSTSGPHYHPVLFSLMCLSGLAELGLTAFLVNAGLASGTWPSPRYHELLIVILVASVWTVLFSSMYLLWLLDGARHLLANVASSIIWLAVTLTLWGVSAGLMHFTRSGGNCPSSAPISRCRQSLTVESLAWVELALTALALCWTILNSLNKPERAVFDSRRMV